MANNKIIGIPRALSYFGNYPFYYGFLKKLGFEIILSDKTTTKTINDGTRYVVSDTCLPVKVYVGHVINLIEKGIDTIFIPSLQSVGYKINNCSKIRALPDIVRNVIDKKINIIEPVLDITQKIGIKDFCYTIANQLNIEDKKLIKEAIKQGFNTYNCYIANAKNGCSFDIAIENAIHNKTIKNNPSLIKPISVVIMAHGYNLFDERISFNLIKKLEKMGVRAYTSLNISQTDAKNAIKQLGEFQYWANEPELTGVAGYYMLNKKIDGIIALSAFGCGPDSLMLEDIRRKSKKFNKPILNLTVDEHTGEAGFITRLEAFCDMLYRNKRKKLRLQSEKIEEHIVII